MESADPPRVPFGAHPDILIATAAGDGYPRAWLTARLPDGAHADWVLDHEENGAPIFAVELQGADPPLKFATSLAQPEKVRLVERINAFLDVESPVGGVAGER